MMIDVKAFQNIRSGLVDIYFTAERPDGKYILYFKDGEIIENIWEIGKEVKPTISIPDRLCYDLATALANINIRPADEKKTEGKLEATERHLKDLRKFFYKKVGLEDRNAEI